MITNFFIPELNNHDVQELWSQQDNATCHTARATIDLLKDTFGDRLISRFGPVNWPPRSCDLTPLYYFCGAISFEKDLLASWIMKLVGFSTNLRNPKDPELAKNGHQHDRQIAKMVTKNDANLALSQRRCQVPIESQL
ncbi:uncharacterized protein TNCV_3139791 [Trichonephila clavipes]|nr:uncharacterized protein TNCV_3139791 [Trichonephila clavipes]